MKELNPLDFPICFEHPARLASSAWIEHIPFAMSLTAWLRPAVFVELGTFTGVSYCAFCQAIARLGLKTKAYAVDTWEGDPHNGSNGQEILKGLRAYHDPRYGSFSRLLPSTFDKGLPRFPNGSIDLLHIDGYHVYEAVKHDFETWLPKMSDRGVIVFHDITVREKDFGVWKLWEELKQHHPFFEFFHCHGLGVLQAGKESPDALSPLFNASARKAARIRAFYFRLGRRLSLQWETDRIVANLKREQEGRNVCASKHSMGLPGSHRRTNSSRSSTELE
jgi:hypothetical protein